MHACTEAVEAKAQTEGTITLSPSPHPAFPYTRWGIESTSDGDDKVTR